MALKVAILGCGPAGMIAAQACALSGTPVNMHIYSNRTEKSHMYGAQYLHAPIPFMSRENPRLVRYELRGTVLEYRRKVYADTAFVGLVSPEKYASGSHFAWNIRETYDNLWFAYGPSVMRLQITSEILMGMLGDYQLVISTVPLNQLCFSGHTFQSSEIWAVGDAPDRGVRCPIRVPEFSVVCNGLDSPAWYRASNVFDRCTVEWPDGSRPPLTGAAKVIKPIRHNCMCWDNSDNLVVVGRYGAWDKQMLVHDVFTQVKDCLDAIRSGIRP